MHQIPLDAWLMHAIYLYTAHRPIAEVPDPADEEDSSSQGCVHLVEQELSYGVHVYRCTNE